MSNQIEQTTAAPPEQAKLLCLLVEFEDAQALFHACEMVRDSKLTRWDAHTPFPVHGLNDAMGLKPSILPYLAFGGGLTGLALALLMQWWMNVKDYPYMISGKPIFSLPANIPVIFELTVLLAAFATFFGMLAINRLPRFNNPVFEGSRFSRVTDDRFFISIDAQDPLFDPAETKRFAESLGGLNVEAVEEVDDAEA